MDLKRFHVDIQRWVNNWARTNAIRYEFSEAVIGASRLNTSINESDYRNENGNRKFTVKYVPPICELEFDCSTNICDTGTSVKPKQKDFYIKQCSRSPVMSISQRDLKDLDGIGANQFFLELLTNSLAAARKSFNTQLIAYFVQNIGLFPDGTNSKVVTLFDVNTKTLDPFGNVYISNTFTDANLGQPFVIGGSHVNFVRSLLPISGLNDVGQNTGALPYGNYFYDKAVNEAFGGGEHLIAFDPQILKFVSYTDNTDRYSTDLKGLSITDIQGLFRQGIDSNIYFGSIIDPVNGLLWDLDVVYKPCVNGDKFGEWRFQFGLNWDIFFMPDRVCNDESVNGVFHFTGCDLVPTVCTPVKPVTPVTKTTFTWTPPADCYPKYINSVKLGNNNYTVEANIADIDELLAVLNALDTYKFTTDGTDIFYTGFSPLTGNINGTIDIEFAE